jgi:hypothetical protein
MALYSHDFVFLPPPPRSLLSYAPESRRDVLPDFATVADLKTFVSRFFHYDLTYVPAVYIQMKSSTSFLCVCVVLAVLVVMRRMYERTFWIIRVIRGPTGRVLVPNSLLCFAIIEGIYVLGCVALVWVIVYTHEYRIVRPFFAPLWITLPWCPLYFGALWATWGTFFATPSQLRRTANPGPKTMLRRFFDNALVTNLAGLVAPVIVCLSIIIPSGWSAAYFKFAQRRYDRWQAMYADATEFNQAMVTEAQLIWFDIVQSNRVLGIVMIIWAVWALVLFIAYNIASLRLIRVIRRELKRSEEDIPVRLGISTIGPAELVVIPVHLSTKSSTTEDSVCQLKELRHENAIAAIRHPYAFSPSTKIDPVVLTLDRYAEDPMDIENLARKEEETSFMHRLKNVDGELAASGQMKPQRSVDSRADVWAHRRLSRSNDDVFEQRSTLHVKKWTPSDIRRNWRHYMPNIVMQTADSTCHESIHVAREMHVKHIRKAYVHICIQYLAICPGTFAFMLIAIGLGATFSGGTEIPFRGGTLFGPILAIGMTAAFWVNVLAGTITFIALALRTYEPVLSSVQLSVRNNGAVGFATAQGRLSTPPHPQKKLESPTDCPLDNLVLDGEAENFLHLTSFTSPPAPTPPPPRIPARARSRAL